MEQIEEVKISRKQIGIRLLYTLLYLIVLEVLKVVVQVAVLFQFVYLLVTQKHSEPLRNFSSKVATYTYTVIQYMTLNTNSKPFPFSEFPAESEKTEEPFRFE